MASVFGHCNYFYVFLWADELKLIFHLSPTWSSHPLLVLKWSFAIFFRKGDAKYYNTKKMCYLQRISSTVISLTKITSETNNRCYFDNSSLHGGIKMSTRYGKQHKNRKPIINIISMMKNISYLFLLHHYFCFQPAKNMLQWDVCHNWNSKMGEEEKRSTCVQGRPCKIQINYILPLWFLHSHQ